MSGEAFSATMALRWVVSPRSDADPVLQQAWLGDRGSVEWRVVETVAIAFAPQAR